MTELNDDSMRPANLAAAAGRNTPAPAADPTVIAPWPLRARPDPDGDPARIRRLAIIVRDDAFDRLLTPLTFAWEMGRRGVEVDILFVLWAVRVLTPEGAREVKIDPRYAHREQWLRERLGRDGDPLDILEFLKLVQATGRVRLHACQLAAATFDVAAGDLVPEANGIIDPAEFLDRIALRADHCQYF
jgi:peroxiredoxin family protein